MKKILDGSNFVSAYDSLLAPYAFKNSLSVGRKYPQTPDPNRLPFQRDIGRIINTDSFRRLKGKMQVVSPQLGDHFRNRLTHTLEVAKVARDLARQLQLNEDLAEAIALAHDLGHPPFGHAGESALKEKMEAFGMTFDHNAQSLRVVEKFECRYDAFDGLNLSQEVLEGMQKHERSFERETGNIFWPHLESQLVDIADEIAYLSADLEDGLRGHFFTMEDLSTLAVCQQALATVGAKAPRRRSMFIGRMIQHLVEQLVGDTQKNLKEGGIQTLGDVQQARCKIVAFNAEFYEDFLALKRFLYKEFYEKPAVRTETEAGKKIIFQVFDDLVADPKKIPQDFLPEENLYQRICDYIAGMTDKYVSEF